MSNEELDKPLTDAELKQYLAWFLISMERLYDLIIFDLYHKYDKEDVKELLENHAKHDYIYPEPGIATEPQDD